MAAHVMSMCDSEGGHKAGKDTAYCLRAAAREPPVQDKADSSFLVHDVSVLTLRQDQKQWRNIAFCLGQLSIGEKGFRKMADMFRCYKDSLADPDILTFFQVASQHTSSLPSGRVPLS